MATPGANLQYGNNEKILAKILKKLGLTPKLTMVGAGGGDASSADTLTGRTTALCAKNGAPANNTAADAPTGIGDICWDATNNDVYRCTAYTNGTTFTWTLIGD